MVSLKSASKRNFCEQHGAKDRSLLLNSVLRIRIRMSLGLLDPDPSITKQKIVRKTLIPTAL
jgi:hypothetical protein